MTTDEADELLSQISDMALHLEEDNGASEQLPGDVSTPVDQRVRRLLVLTGKSAKGKNRLREAAAAMPGWDGSWRVQDEQERVTFAPGVRGPWLFVAPRGADSASQNRFSRWVHEYADEHFDVTAAQQRDKQKL